MTHAIPTGERLLVVDDEPDIAALVTFHLIKAGYRVSTASNGPDAIAQTRQEHPVLVVLDLMLPGMSGYDVLEQLRADDATRDVAVQRCRTVSERFTEERIDGYLVTYQYQGRNYTMQTALPPGDRVPLAVDVRPVAYRVRY